MACGDTAEIEEERRLLYVAMTRARDELHLIHPKRLYTHGQARTGDRHVFAPRSRFIPGGMVRLFNESPAQSLLWDKSIMTAAPTQTATIQIAAELREMWR